MPEGIKLYKHFVEQISKMGKIKRAWFTTFNLDVSFFEKYILSALMNIPYEELDNAIQYESLSSNLEYDEEITDREKMEVRVFYDYRALKVIGKQKLTSVHLHPIDITKLTNLNPNLKFTGGVFHPKIVLIENYDGEYWLMVSSANLTFGGWSKNREGFFCEKINDRQNAKLLREFFFNIMDSLRGETSSILPQRILTSSFPEESARWHFFSSFSDESFIEQIKSSSAKTFLRVWSPYYCDDLHLLIEELQQNDFEIIEIIPAQNENRKIRITKETYDLCSGKKGVSFKQDRLPKSAEEAFVHAKVFLTQNALAIGSWNMTRSGLNISKKGNNNVEAGIIHKISQNKFDSILSDYTVSGLKSPEHFSQDELNLDKENSIDNYSVYADLVADWDKMELCLQNPTYGKLIKDVNEDDCIILPGFPKQKISALQEKINFRRFSKNFLYDRFFEIESKDGEVLYRGYIREIGLANRPVKSFENIDDYLKGWVSEYPEGKDELHRLAYKTDDETEDGLSEHTKEILFSDKKNFWYTGFYAFECILIRINKAKDKKVFPLKPDRVSELKKIGRVLPGSLSELRMHLKKLLEIYKEEPGNFKKSPIYLWFLIEKANQIFKYFNNAIDDNSESIKRIKNLEVTEFLNEKDIEKFGGHNLEEWKNYIIKKLKVSEDCL